MWSAFRRQRRRQLRHDLEQVADQAVIGDLEDRRLLVLVDGDDDLAVLHAGQVLDGAGDADGDVELGRHDLAGLADLVVVGHEAGVDRGARGADGGAELVGERLEHLEVLARAHAAAARDDDLRAEVSSGRSRPLTAPGATKRDSPASAASPTRLDRGAAAARGGRRRRRCRAR